MRGWDAKSSTADRYSASPAINRYHPNHPPTLSPPPYSYSDFYDNGHNYGDDAHSSQPNYWNAFSPYPGSSNLPLLVPTNNINTPQEWLRQTPPGDYTTPHPAPGDIDPSPLTYNVADYSTAFPGVSQPSVVGEIAPELHKPSSAPSRGKLTDHEPIKSAKRNQCLQCLQCFDTMTQLNRHRKGSKHVAFKCKCEATFGRYAELVRHLAPYRSTNPAFPCNLCIRHRGKDGFWRKDHLTQHIRNCHRVTSENTSVEDRQQRKNATPVRAPPRSGRSNMAASEGRLPDSAFECTEENCDMVEASGSMSKSDSANHHSVAQPWPLVFWRWALGGSDFFLKPPLKCGKGFPFVSIVYGRRASYDLWCMKYLGHLSPFSITAKSQL